MVIEDNEMPNEIASKIVENAEKDNPSHQTLAHQLGIEQTIEEVIQLIDNRILEIKSITGCFNRNEAHLRTVELEWLKRQLRPNNIVEHIKKHTPHDEIYYGDNDE